MSEELSAHDVGIVRDALEDIEAEPPPKNWGAVGVMAALVGVVALVVVPLLARTVPVPHGAVITALVMGAALVVLGVVARASAGGFARGRSIAAAEAALRQLESDDPDRETALRAATLLLVHAYAMYGPKPSASFDFLAGRRRLGERVPLVEAVERELLRDNRIDPVFTDAPLDEGDGGGEEEGR